MFIQPVCRLLGTVGDVGCGITRLGWSVGEIALLVAQEKGVLERSAGTRGSPPHAVETNISLG
jgi:hypothetical protein